MFRLAHPMLIPMLAVVLSLAWIQPAVAANGITLYNGINMDITSLKLRDGSVAGFQTLPPGHGVVVGLETNDGSCAGWIVARTRSGDAANALVDICHPGNYYVTLTPRVGNRGTANDLTIRPLR